MSWAGLAAVLVVTLLLQTAVCPMGELPLIDLNLLLVLVLVYGLVAPVHHARIAGWIIGLAADLTTEGPLGIHAFAFGLTGLLLTQMRQVVNRQSWWVRLLIGLLAALPGQLLIWLHLRFMQGAATGVSWEMLWLTVLDSLAAALLAALITRIPALAPRRRLTSRPAWGRR